MPRTQLQTKSDSEVKEAKKKELEESLKRILNTLSYSRIKQMLCATTQKK
jgi:hypothetical protein